eukprot:4395667-Prymnesium_polylepis.1
MDRSMRVDTGPVASTTCGIACDVAHHRVRLSSASPQQRLVHNAVTTHRADNNTEYNAPAGARKYEHPAGHALAGQRDLQACTRDYQHQWKLAVQTKILTKCPPSRGAAGAGPRHGH